MSLAATLLLSLPSPPHPSCRPAYGGTAESACLSSGVFLPRLPSAGLQLTLCDCTAFVISFFPLSLLDFGVP